MKCSLSDNDLFDSLSGRLDEFQSKRVEEHLAECDECSLVALLVQQFKSEPTGSTVGGEVSEADTPSEKRPVHPGMFGADAAHMALLVLQVQRSPVARTHVGAQTLELA